MERGLDASRCNREEAREPSQESGFSTALRIDFRQKMLAYRSREPRSCDHRNGFRDRGRFAYSMSDDGLRNPGQSIVGTDRTILNFWQWGYSNILPNITRAVFAEYLVGLALGAINHPRKPWAGTDVKYANRRIEVKSTAFDQSWGPAKGEPAFEIAEHGEWFDEDETGPEKKSRLDSRKMFRSDLYVLSCLKEGADEANVINPSQWEFWVLRREEIVKPGKPKSRITVGSLRKRPSVAFRELRHAVDQAIRSIE